MSQPDIRVTRANTKRFTVPWTDANGDPISLDGADAWLTVREKFAEGTITDDDDAIINQEQLSISDPSGTGVLIWNLTAEDTDIDYKKDYVMDIKVNFASGSEKSTRTFSFKVEAGVTRSR